MILFQSDWCRYNSAIIDTQTKNKSFLRIAMLLKSMGVKNNSFMLALHNPRLQGIDPHSDDLTMEEMTMIGIEARMNPWYSFREIFRAPSKAGIESNMVEANRGNIALWWCFFTHIIITLIQPRQTGKSFSTDLLMTQLMNFICSNTQINLLTKDDTLRTDNISRLKDIYEELPAYLNFKTRADANNTEALTIDRFGNSYITHVPQSSPKRAYNIGRGLSSPIIHIDEGPFQANIDISMGALLAAMGAAAEEAEINGEPYGVILTTTAGKKDSNEGKHIFNYASDSAIWSERFLDAENMAELKKMIMTNSRKGAFRVYCNLGHRQLGKTDDWMKKQLDRNNQTPDDANRDMFGIWSSGTLTSPLSIAILEIIRANIGYELYSQINPICNYILRWYIAEDEIKHYMATRKVIIGVDTSDASGGDDISVVMTDVETGQLVAIGTFNETNLIKFAQWLIYLLETYENTTMIIERRSSGITIIDYLLLFLPQRNIDPFVRLFNWIMNDPLEYKQLYEEAIQPMRRRSEELYVRAKKYFGFATSGGGQTSRSELYSTTLQNAAKRCADKIKDRSLSEQITGLIIRNGRVDHEIGGHDDLVIGFLLCHWFLSMAKNLLAYGIDPKIVMRNNVTKKELVGAEAYFSKEQEEIRSRILNLSDRLNTESEPVIIERLENELRYLDTRLILNDGEYCSIDAIITEARDNKKKNTTVQINSDYDSIYSKYGYSSGMIQDVTSFDSSSAINRRW